MVPTDELARLPCRLAYLVGVDSRTEKADRTEKLGDIMHELDINRDFWVHPRQGMCCAAVQGDVDNCVKLSDVYKNPSKAKVKAYERCLNLCQKYDGFDFCITGHTCHTFTVAFDFMHPETGEYMTARITRSYNHAYYIHNL